MPYYNVIVTIEAINDTEAEQIVERGIDKQGFVVLDICADIIKDENLLKELDEQGLDNG
ncbi:MAG: hypothetical protein V3S69_08000 [Dehalococcoidales bacterium]